MAAAGRIYHRARQTAGGPARRRPTRPTHDVIGRTPLRGLVQGRALLISQIIDYAALYHGDTEIVTRTVEGPIHRYTYADAQRRAKQAANALDRLGIRLGDRVATLAWNTYRHFELYYGVSGIGAVLHTINPRLFPDQIAYIANHAEDRVLFTDLTFLPLLEQIQDQLGSVEAFVVLTDQAHMPATTLRDVHCYETLLAAESADLEWPMFDEMTASSLCYTSGTTRRACCTRTGRPCCTRWPPACATSWGCRRWTACCRWCRCSMPTPGASPTPRR